MFKRPFTVNINLTIGLAPATLARVDQIIALAGGMTPDEIAAVTAKLMGYHEKFQAVVQDVAAVKAK